MNSVKACLFAFFLSFIFLSILFPCPSNADPLDNWHWRNPLPQGNDLFGITYGKNIFIAVGSSGTIITSTDAMDWTQRESGVAGEILYDVQYGDSLFVAVGGNGSPDGNSGVIATSPDGTVWATRTSGSFRTLRSLTYGNGMYVTVGDGGTILTSNDGASWTALTVSTALNLNSITFGNGMFVAVGGGTGYKETVILTSTDGVTWTQRDPDTDNGLFGITFADGKFVAVGNNRVVLVSTDGVNWTQRSIDVNATGPFTFYRVSYSNGLYVAVGNAGLVATSSDGMSWNATVLNTSELNGITCGSGTFIIVGYNGVILTSPDGAEWTLRTSGTRYRFNGITYADGSFIAVGADYGHNGNGMILTSPDGITWTSTISGITNRFNSAAYADDKYGGLFVAVGDNGAILISQDKTNWSIVESCTTMTLNKVIYEQGRFVAVGGAIITSSDGINWSQVSTPESAIPPSGFGVAYGNGIFDAFGFLSPDGVNWTPIIPAVNPQYIGNISFNDIAFGNGIFVAVGGTQSIGFGPPMPLQVIITSPDGINWMEQESPGVDPLYGVTFENNTFVAVGANGTVLTSPDGVDWTLRVPKTTDTLSAIGFGNGTFIAVGYGGTILQSDPVSGACTATLSADLSLHIPVIAFDGTDLWADESCGSATDGTVLCRVTGYGEANPADFKNCQAATLSAEFDLHVPATIYSNISYEAEFEYLPTSDGQIWFKLTGGAKN
jgi:Photosynthesis system II assembly factor YCF48